MQWLLSFGAVVTGAISSHWQTLVIDAVLTGILIYPLCNFLTYGWQRKFEEIKTDLVPEAKQTYLKVFWDRKVDLDKVDKEFSDLYARWYGRGRFRIPTIFVFVVAIIENFVLATELSRLLSPDAQLSTAGAAIAGAYTFVAWDFFGRVQRRDLSSADILRGALRLAVAVPLGFAMSALLEKGYAPFLAFAIGVFPLETISTILRRLVNDKLKLQIGADNAPDQVATLSGVDRSIADRIQEADITTIPQLAWCDPIQLTMRTNLGFDYVVDIVSQALAWVYFGEKLAALRSFGLRGAFELHVLSKDLKSANPEEKALAEKTQNAAAQAISVPLDGFKYAVVQIAEDPATKFLYDAS